MLAQGGFSFVKGKKRRVRHPQKVQMENCAAKANLTQQEHEARHKHTARMKIVCIGAGYVGGEHLPNTAGFSKMLCRDVA